MRKIILTFLLFMSTGMALNNAAAKDLDDAVAAMRAGDFAEAYCIMRPLAESGDADSQYNIGWMYLNGYGLRVNDGLALQWWQKASEQGHIDATFSIGMLYSLGEGDVPKDNDKAVDYYLLAAEGGQEDAVTILTSMILRNDKAIHSRIYSILKNNESLFGVERKVKAKKLNVRSKPSTESVVVASLVKDQTVLEMEKQGKWSRVAILTEPSDSLIAWVYNPLLEAAVITADD